MEPFDSWRADPKFNALSDDDKAHIYETFFDREIADDKFKALPTEERFRVKGNFLADQGLNIASKAQAPEPVKAGVLSKIGDSDELRAARRTLENVGQVYPALETAASLATNVYGFPASGLAGIAAGTEAKPPTEEGVQNLLTDPNFMPGQSPYGLTFNIEKAAKAIQKVQDTLIYQPQTQRGKELTEAATYPFKKLGEAAEKAGDYVYEKTDSHLLAIIAQSGIEAAPVLLPALRIAGKGTLKKIRNSTAYRRATIKERGMVAQSLAETLKKNPKLSEAELVRKSDQYFKEAATIRAKGETPQAKAPAAKTPQQQPTTEIAGRLPAGQGFEIVGERPRGFDLVPSQAAYVGPDGVARMPEKGLPPAPAPTSPAAAAVPGPQPRPIPEAPQPGAREAEVAPSLEERAQEVFGEEVQLPTEQERLRRRQKMAEAKTAAVIKKDKTSVQALRKRIDSLGKRLETEKRPFQRMRLEKQIEKAGQQLKQKVRSTPAEPQQAEPPQVKEPGQKQRVMDQDAILEDSQRIDGVDYELYREGENGIVRIYDADSGEVVGITKYEKQFEKAEEVHAKAVELAGGETKPVKGPTIDDQVQGEPVPVAGGKEPSRVQVAPELSILPEGVEHRKADRRQSVINQRFGRSPERRVGDERRQPPLVPQRKADEIGDYAVRRLKQRLTEELAHEKVPLEASALEAKKVAEMPRVKEAWEMTREENWAHFVENRPKMPSSGEPSLPTRPSNYKRLASAVDKRHKASVERALAEGKPIPPDVLKDYPKLKRPKGQALAQTKKQKALTEYQDYIKTLSDEQKQVAGGLIKEAPAFPSAQKRKIEKVLAEKPTDITPPDKRVTSLRKAADSLQKQIDEKNNPATAQQNITHRRAGIIAGMAQQAEGLQKTQTVMRGMADAIEAGTLPKSLEGLKSKPQIEEVLRKSKWEYARPTVRRDDLHAVAESIKGVRGSVKIKAAVTSILRRPTLTPGGYLTEIRNQDEAKAVETLLRFADKYGKGLQTGSWGPVGRVRGDLREGKRLLSAGIDTKVKFDAAKKDLEQYVKPPSKKDLEKKNLQELEHGLIGTKIPGFFPTPKPVIARMLEEAEIESGMKVLEPSAGKGDIADAIKETGATPDVVEFSGTLKPILEAKGYEVKGTDFLEYDQGGYDRIVMNPPFEKGQDIEHVQHAYKLLKPDGRLVSIMSEGPFFRGDTKAEKFRDWLESVGGTSEKLEASSFKGKESFRQTGVATRVVVVDKAVEKPPTGGTTLYSGIPIDAMLKQIKKLRADIPEKDITLLKQVSSVPHWVAKTEPKFKVVQDIIEERYHHKNIIKNGYLQDLLPTFKALSKKESERAGDVLWRGDELGMVLSEKGLEKLAPKERAAYETVRDVLDFIRDDIIALMGELEVPKTEIDKVRRMLNEWVGFMPHPREGKYFARAIEKNKVVWRQHFDDLLATMTRGQYGWRAPFVEKKLEKMFPEAFVELGKNTKDLAEESYFDVSPMVTQQLLDATIDKLEYSDPFKEDIKASMEQAAADIFNVRGFMAHAKKRKNIAGFDKSNWQDAVIQYVAAYAGYKSKLIASKKLYETWHKIDWKGTEKLEKYAKKQVRDTFTNEDRVDRALSKVRSFLFFKYLGAVVKSALIQVTQNYVAAVPRLTKDTNFAGTKITAEMGRAGADVIKTFYTKAAPGKTRRQTAQGKRLSATVQRGLTRARENGIIGTELTDEIMGQMPGEYGSVPREVANGLKFMFGAMEIFNRETTYVTAFRIAEKKGKGFNEAADYAEEIVKDTHFLYGKFNLPPFTRGDVGRRVRPIYTFRTYPHQLFSLYKYLGTEAGPRGKYGLIKALLALSFFGGVSALPFIEDVEKLFMKATGKNIRSETKEMTGEWATHVLYGAPGALGVDITGSIGTELPSDIADMLGVPWAVGEDIYHTYKDIEAGDWQRAIEDSPLTFQFTRYPLAAYRYATRGLENRRGKAILNDDFEPIKITKTEAAKKALGFQPVRIAEHYRTSDARYQTKKHWEGKKDVLVKKWAIAANTEGVDSAKADAVIKEIDEYHEVAPDFAPLITPEVLRNALTHRKPSKREVALKEAVK